MATYTIIGSDQKPYSPVTPDDIRRWIAEGRLNGQSLMKSEGDAEFRPLSTFAEFAAALAARTPAESPPTSLSPVFARTATTVATKTSRLAIASLALGILGVFTCGVTALIGLILGIVAMVKIRRSQGALRGDGNAQAGIVVSGISLLVVLLFAVFAKFAGVPHAQFVTCMCQVKELSRVMCTYAYDNQNHYPAATNWCDVLLRSDAGATNTFQSHPGMTNIFPNIFHCPADRSGSRCSYAFNTKLAGAEIGKVDPNTVMIFESAGGWNLSGGKELLLAKSRHCHIVVVGFADGHTENVPESQLAQLRWNP
jgi:hypothetical protein